MKRTPYLMTSLILVLLFSCACSQGTTQQPIDSSEDSSEKNNREEQPNEESPKPDQKEEVPDDKNGDNKKKTCSSSATCGDGNVCRGGVCVERKNLCDDLNCPERTRCEAGICIPDCESPCGGVCCAPGLVCHQEACIEPCTDGRSHCDVDGTPTCCGEGTGCLGTACVPLHSSCDEAQETYCPITQYCETEYQKCVNYEDNAELCLYRPSGTFEPVVKLHWDGTRAAHQQDYKQVMSTPVVGDLNKDSIPDIVFNTFKSSAYTKNGVLRVISGKTKSADVGDIEEIWDSQGLGTDSFWTVGVASPAIGDINGDNDMNVVIPTLDPAGLVATRSDGTRLWTNTSINTQNHWSSVTLANLDGEGASEVLILNYVLDGATGNTLCQLGGSNWTLVAADLDGDGVMEIVAGRRVYKFQRNQDGSATCTVVEPIPGDPSSIHPAKNHRAFSAVADIKYAGHDTPEPEIVTVSYGHVYLSDHRGKQLWDFNLPGRHNAGPPTVADFDGDGELEIGIADSDYYLVLEGDGTEKWRFKVQDASSGVTGSSVFDFDGDGRAEVVYNDEVKIRVLNGEGDGNGGTNVLYELPNPSGTAIENPVIVDVDNDGHADIVTAANNYHIPGVAGIRVLADRENKWVPTRKIWNQHTYHVTNVNEDGSIPLHEKQHWKQPWSNNFRQNIQKGNPFLAPNVIGKIQTIYDASCSTTNDKTIRYTISNSGNRDVQANVLTSVVSVAEAGTQNYVEIDRRLNAQIISVGGSEQVAFDWTIPTNLQGKMLDIKLNVDVEDVVKECHEDDNEYILKNVAAAAPNLNIIPLTVDNYCSSNQKVMFKFELHNTGGAKVPSNTGRVSIYAGSGTYEKIGEITNTKDIEPNTYEELSYEWEVPSKYYNVLLKTKLVVDELNEIVECVEEDNEVEYENNYVCTVLG